MEDYALGDGSEKRDEEGGAERGTAKDAGQGQTNIRLESNLAGMQQRSVMPSVRMLNRRTVEADQTPEGLGLEDQDVILVLKSKDLVQGPQTDEFVRVGPYRRHDDRTSKRTDATRTCRTAGAKVHKSKCYLLAHHFQLTMCRIHCQSQPDVGGNF